MAAAASGEVIMSTRTGRVSAMASGSNGGEMKQGAGAPLGSNIPTVAVVLTADDVCILTSTHPPEPNRSPASGGGEP